MKEIQQENYLKFKEIVKELDWHLSSLAVVEGNNPGRVLCDRMDVPGAMFIMSPEGCYLAGDPNDERFKAALRNYLKTQFLKEHDDFELIFLPKWEVAVLHAFEKTKLLNYKRYHYIISRNEYFEQVNSEAVNAKPQKISSDHVRNKLGIRNMKHVNDWILNNWGSYNNFDKKGFGYFILENDKVVSWSVCDCRTEDRCEIGIWADPDERLKGNATVVVRAMLDHAFNNGFKEVGWHCSWNNVGSYRTAEKCGFKREREYLSYYPAEMD